jgi:hypothetical protein
MPANRTDAIISIFLAFGIGLIFGRAFLMSLPL